MSLRAVLTERSWRHLVEFVDFTLQPMLHDATSETERDRAVELHLVTFREFESLLKLTVDRRDAATLTSIDTVWSEIAEDPWWLWEEDPAHHEEPAQTRIARDRVVGRMGVAMWTAHEAAREQDPAVRKRLLEMLRQVSGHLDTLDHLFLAEEWAEQDEDARQWDRWFLEQLPERRAHYIPTRQQLLLATLLVALDRVSERVVVRPRRWMTDRWDEIDETLRRVESDQERWAPALGFETTVAADPNPSATPRQPSIPDRVHLLRQVLAQARDAAREAERGEIQEAHPDPAKRDELRDRILAGFAERRVLRPLLERVGAVTALGAKPEEHERQVFRTWLPKELLVADGRMVGIDLVARDLVSASLRAEVEQMLGALPTTAADAVEEALGAELRRRLGALMAAGREPSLVLMPISWHVREALELEPVGDQLVEELGAACAQSLEGTIEGVPVLDTPLIEDRVWVIDLRGAMRYEEWPSEDNSGLSFEIQFFDRSAAERLLAEHPEIRGEDQTDDDVVQDVRTKALLQLGLCFRFEPQASDAAVAVLLPEALRP